MVCRSFWILLFICQFLHTQSQSIVLLKPTGNEIEGLTEMIPLSDTSDLHDKAINVIENSFIRESLKLHGFVQQYLVNTGVKDHIEPAYLALTTNQGGYARRGFALKQGNDIHKKPETFYVDIVEGNFRSDPGKLMSVTQLYPHELGHVLYRLLSSAPDVEETSRSVNVHFFSVITDYQIAFNEGFAESMENVARLFEPNDSIKQGIESDVIEKESKFDDYIRGYRRDHQWSPRMDFYKASMITWYQQFEDYKRYRYPVEKLAHWKNEQLVKGSLNDRISYRNSGVRRTGEKRNISQSHATEGVVSTFFSQLFLSDLKENYVEDPSFYSKFLEDTTASIQPMDLFSPMQNQMLKVFTVFAEYVDFHNSGSSQLLDFVNGYVERLPEESTEVIRIYEGSTEHGISASIPPSVWMMVKEYDHRMIVLDQFDGLTLPLYTFDMNQAEIEDLLTMGISEESAIALLDYRKNSSPFDSLQEVITVPGLPDEDIRIIESNQFDQEYFDNLPEPELNIQALIVTPLLHIAREGLLLFLFIIVIRYTLFYKSRKSIPLNISKYFITWYLLVILGLISVVATPNPTAYFLASSLAFLLIGIAIYRKEKHALIRNLVMSLVMIFISSLSVV